MEILVLIAVFWMEGKILKGIFGGFSKSDFRHVRGCNLNNVLPLLLL